MVENKPWLTALAASALQEPAMPVAPLMISFDGLDVPVLQLVLAVAGVLMARPLAPRRDPPLGFVRSLLVTAIMVIAAVVWVADARPGVLFERRLTRESIRTFQDSVGSAGVW